MNFVDHYLSYFSQWLITHTLSARLPFQSLFTGSLCGDQLLALPHSLVHLEHPAPSAACSFSVPCLLFSFVLFFFQGRGQSVHGAMLVYLRGSCGNAICHIFAHLLVYWMSPKEVWSRHLEAWEPSCFFSVTWCGEALYGLAAQGVDVLILLAAFFCQVWLQCVSKIFDLQS
jgi:hypothetical protein